eukprot:SAG11_NODE_25206_length_362_cov_0.775665_1_plen_96_part_01
MPSPVTADPATCGDPSDWDTCSGYTGLATCDGASKCVWDTSVAGYHHCTVACTVVVAGSATTATVGGLTNGAWYRFTVTATNDYGTGAHSVWEGNC